MVEREREEAKICSDFSPHPASESGSKANVIKKYRLRHWLQSTFSSLPVLVFVSKLKTN